MKKVVLVSNGEVATGNGFSFEAFSGKVPAGASLVLDRFSVSGDAVLGFAVVLDDKVILTASGPVSATFDVSSDSVFKVIVTLWRKGSTVVIANGEAYYTIEVGR